jgi:HK97 family phage major capsid protein
MTTLYELKQSRNEVGQQLKKVTGELSQKAGQPGVEMSEIRELKQQRDDLQERFNIVNEQVTSQEKMEADKLDKQPLNYDGLDEKAKIVKAKAEFYRQQLIGKPMSTEAKQLLYAIPEGNDSGGDKLLPTNVSNEIITEPLAKNQLRAVARVTNIKGLEMPRLSYTIDDDDFITDLQSAKELQLKGDSMSFGRHKFKAIAKISDTVIHGSDLDLVNWVENALKSAAANKEKKDALAVTPKAGLEHMSFYAPGVINEVSGTDMASAITNAIADLHEDYRENAKVVMRYADYLAIVKDLNANGTNLHNALPETVLGKPVTFSDLAVRPIVGDFSQYTINYDMTTFDTDKDVKTGHYLFVWTVWYDQQRSLDSAFRIATVTAAEPAGV